MLDPLMRKLIDPPLNMAARLWPASISANMITFGGGVFGVGCFLAIAGGQFTLALILLLLNRLADGLDGAVARRNTPTDLGAYLDIVADFLLWSLLPLAFIIYRPDNAIAAAVLLSSFAMSMVVFLAYAILAEKRGEASEAQGRKSFFYLAGLVEGTETIGFFALVLTWPTYFPTAAYVFALFVYVSVIDRIRESIANLQDTGFQDTGK